MGGTQRWQPPCRAELLFCIAQHSLAHLTAAHASLWLSQGFLPLEKHSEHHSTVKILWLNIMGLPGFYKSEILYYDLTVQPSKNLLLRKESAPRCWNSQHQISSPPAGWAGSPH